MTELGCGQCRFYQANNAPDSAFVPDWVRGRGLCRRFPAYVARSADDWCGELKAIPAKQEARP